MPACRNPEWQTNCLASEFMMEADLVKGMDASDVALECGVSPCEARFYLYKGEVKIRLKELRFFEP